MQNSKLQKILTDAVIAQVDEFKTEQIKAHPRFAKRVVQYGVPLTDLINNFLQSKSLLEKYNAGKLSKKTLEDLKTEWSDYHKQNARLKMAKAETPV